MMRVLQQGMILSVGRFWLALALGCGSGGPNVAPVEGKVTFGGKPLADATIRFEPAEGVLPPSVGKTDEEGKYELYYNKDVMGATIGEQIVRITSFGAIGDDCERQVLPEKVPARYNMKSELKVAVKRGTNTFDFDLKPGGEIIQPDSEQPAERPAAFTGCY